MKYILTIFLFFLMILSQSMLARTIIKSDTTSINFIRQTFYKAVEDENKLLELTRYFEQHYSKNYDAYPPLILAYYGGAEALKAKYAFNPFSKLSYLNTSLEYLADAINKSPQNLEIRFLRYSILVHLPGILGYGKEEMDDQKMILNLLETKNYGGLSKDIYTGIIEFMIEKGVLSPEELKQLKILYTRESG